MNYKSKNVPEFHVNVFETFLAYIMSRAQDLFRSTLTSVSSNVF